MIIAWEIPCIPRLETKKITYTGVHKSFKFPREEKKHKIKT